MIPYTTADFKKYVYARSVHRIRRIEEIIEALDGAHGFHPEVTNDLGYEFEYVCRDLWRAAFIDDDDQAEAQLAAFEEAWQAAVPEDVVPEEIQKAQEAANAYSDGRPVTTTARFGDGKHDYVTHVWHPDPLHPLNRPGAEILVAVGPYPFRFRRLIVTAPGFIDTVDEEDEKDDLFGDDETASRSDTKAPPAPATDWTSLQRLLLEKTIQPPRTGHDKQDEQ